MSLKNKAAKLDFSQLPGVGAAGTTPAESRPKTAPGALMAFANDTRSELLRENEKLRAQATEAQELKGRLDDALYELKQWDGSKATRLIDAAHVQPSRWANRHASNFSTPEFAQLKAEIADAGGNVQPIKVRPIGEVDGQARYEVVYGHRRLEACRQLELPVLCVIDNLEDQALFIEMERENRGRKDLSAWEQGVMYRRALDAGLFPSLRQLAKAVGVQPGNASTALQLASLPEEVVQAFPSPLDLQFRWIGPLKAALERDEVGVIAKALELSQQRPKGGAKEVLSALTQLGEDEEANDGSTPEPVRRKLMAKGKAVGSWEKDGRGGLKLRLSSGALTPPQEAELFATVARLLEQ